ncbi:MAG: NAD(P)-dependent oxidoreductase [Bdellovibrionaceae bacterium]|nr:NAD(P)-dependent oxidoreductase [Pseudobdellovibrionaceae bacterium]
MNALIGYTGFVGSTLLKQSKFDQLFRSTNIADIEGQHFDIIVCAGAPGQKWLANSHPDKDLQIIEKLMEHLKKTTCDKFILISTVDVFLNPVAVDENSQVEEAGLNPYGLHRRQLELFAMKQFCDHLIVRLPGLVGPGLRKNIIFDMLNDNDVSKIDSRSCFQFYPMVNLWYDIQTALNANLSLVHLTAEPVSVCEVSKNGFCKVLNTKLDVKPANYDMRSIHSQLYNPGTQPSNYQYDAKSTFQAVRSYAQSENKTLRNTSGN